MQYNRYMSNERKLTRRSKMHEQWSIKKIGNTFNIVSNQSKWFIAEDVLYNNAMTIITHFNNNGRVKIDKNGDAV